jgi:hypothetical protein
VAVYVPLPGQLEYWAEDGLLGMLPFSIFCDLHVKPIVAYWFEKREGDHTK